MKTIKILMLAIVAASMLASCSGGAADGSAALLDSLDRAIANRDAYIRVKESRIDSLKAIYRSADSPARQFQALGDLYDEYRSYNSDSAMLMCTLRQQIAPLTGNPNDTIHARMNMADQLGFTGMYTEAFDIIADLDSHELPDYLRPYLFHIKRTTYGLLADYSVRQEDKEKYGRLTDMYRDSLLSVNTPESLIYQIVRCDQLNNHGQAAEAAADLQAYLSGESIGAHDAAIAAFTLADSYHRLGDKEREKRQLLISSINDMQSAVKEYISLRSLALMLYQEGDVEHAYKYLRRCMDDAQECNARQRIVEINSIFPVVNEVYLDTIDSQQRKLKLIIGLVCLLAAGLLGALFMIRKQMKRVSEARANVEAMNSQLTRLNDELKQYNAKLVDANKAIAENSCLKEEYIARYMDQCLIYIDKLDTYRKSLNKLALAGQLDELKRQTKSVTFIDGELKAFYDNFDATFLRLFPTFVDDFNALLRPDERIYPKAEGKLNTELRIFALIRLGINDSAQIARFLRYSVTTIYNYRTRTRNKAIGDRDLLEDQIMTIGSLSGRV